LAAKSLTLDDLEQSLRNNALGLHYILRDTYEANRANVKYM